MENTTCDISNVNIVDYAKEHIPEIVGIAVATGLAGYFIGSKKPKGKDIKYGLLDNTDSNELSLAKKACERYFERKLSDEEFADRYQGKYVSKEDFVQHLIYDDETLYSRNALAFYVDLDWMWEGSVRHDYAFEDGYVFYSS